MGKVFTLGNIPPGNAGFEQAFDLDGEELVSSLIKSASSDRMPLAIRVASLRIKVSLPRLATF